MIHIIFTLYSRCNHVEISLMIHIKFTPTILNYILQYPVYNTLTHQLIFFLYPKIPTTMSQTKPHYHTEYLQKRIQIPSYEFQKDEFQSIRAILGNDVYIDSYTKNDIILPNGYLLVDVKYDQIDFNTFNLYLAENVKQLNLNSDKYIVKIENKYVKIIKPSKEKFYIKLYAAKPEIQDEQIQINYYGLEIKKPRDILHNFCSIFGVKKLSYHGTVLESHITTYTNPLKTKISPLDETMNFKNINVINKDYINSYINMASFKVCDLINELPVVTLKDKVETTCIIDFESSTPEELKKFLVKLEKGYIILSDSRNPTSLIYILDNDYTLTEQQIDYTILTIGLDLENLQKWVDLKE